MTDPDPIPVETLRSMFAPSGLTLTDEELVQLGMGAARAKILQDSLRTMFADVVEPAPVFSPLQPYSK